MTKGGVAAMAPAPAPFAVELLPGDMLEEVLASVPPPAMARAGRVSKEWRRAARAALRRRPPGAPWLILFLRSPFAGSSIHCFDPHFRCWLALPAPAAPAKHLVCSSKGHRFCSLTLRRLVLYGELLGMPTVDLPAPRVWRGDPALAAVGGKYVVAIGGGCTIALEDDEHADSVEVYEDGKGWRNGGLVPPAFKDSASATWLSAAASDKRVYIVDKASGWATWFDPAADQWGPVRRLDDSASSFAVVAAANDSHLVLLTLTKHGNSENRVTMHTVDADTLSLVGAAEGYAMPEAMSARLFPKTPWGDAAAVGACGTAASIYVYNAGAASNGAAMLEVKGDQPSAKWEWVAAPESVEETTFRRLAVGCAVVGPEEIARVVFGAAGLD